MHHSHYIIIAISACDDYSPFPSFATGCIRISKKWHNSATFDLASQPGTSKHHMINHHV